MRILGVVSSSSREVPDAPTIGTATDVGTGRAYNNGAATVSFTAPTFDGGLPITGYTVTSSPGGFTATGAASPLTVTGLQSATAYTFTVVATNSAGNSTASAASNSITATTVPQAPTIGTATGGDASATVAYTAGATGGKTVSTYTATSSPGSLTGTGSSPITVSGLTNGTAYTFTVTATNANGTSTASAASNSVTPVQPTAFESIATATGTGSSNTITFSSIPGTYQHLQIRFIAKDTNTSLSSYSINVNFNGTTTNYAAHRLIGDGSNASATASSAATTITTIRAIAGNDATVGADTYGVGIIDIHDYASTTKNKVMRMFNGIDGNDTSSSFRVNLVSGLSIDTNAITSISLQTNGTAFTTGTTFALYGIKGA
jgi:hypothetical protein